MMLEDLSNQVFSAFSDGAELRLEAMQLLEQGLRSGNVADVTRFIERQLGQDPPHLLLLSALAGDLFERLEILRAHQADVSEQVTRVLRDSYSVDVTPLMPDLAPDCHMVQADVLERILACSAEAAHDLPLLRRLIEASLDKAAELQRKIELTAQVLGLLDDWLGGISATAARQHWDLLVDHRARPDRLH